MAYAFYQVGIIFMILLNKLRSFLLQEQGLLDNQDEKSNDTIKDPEAFEQALRSVAEFINSQEKLYRLIHDL